jgi:hypothetical protein
MVKLSIKIILLAISTLYLSSCMSSNMTSISEDVYLVKPDKFNPPNTKIYVGSMIDIKPVTFGSSGFSQFRLRYEQSNGQTAWVINSIFSDDSWIFVRKIKFLVNNNIYEFNSMSNPFREVGYPLGGSNCYEENNFIINNDFSKVILAANQISIRLIGGNFYIDRDLSNQDIQKLKNFITYIESKIVANYRGTTQE